MGKDTSLDELEQAATAFAQDHGDGHDAFDESQTTVTLAAITKVRIGIADGHALTEHPRLLPSAVGVNFRAAFDLEFLSCLLRLSSPVLGGRVAGDDEKNDLPTTAAAQWPWW